MRWLLVVFLLVSGLARAAEFDPPGLAADSNAYRRALTQRSPAGLSPALQLQAEQRADAAVARGDWAAAATALETRLGAGDGDAAPWLLLARVQLRRTPADAAHAAQAAWQAYSRTDTGPAQIPALLLLADALKGDEPAAGRARRAGGGHRTRAGRPALPGHAGRYEAGGGLAGPARTDGARERSAAGLRRIHHAAVAPGRSGAGRLGAARAGAAGCGGDAAAGRVLHRWAAVGGDDGGELASRPAGRGRADVAAGYTACGVHAEPGAAAGVRPAAVPAAARPGAAPRAGQREPVLCQAEAAAAERAQPGAVVAREQPRPGARQVGLGRLLACIAPHFTLSTAYSPR